MSTRQDFQNGLLKVKRVYKKRSKDELQYGEMHCPKCNHHSVNVFWIKHASGQRAWRYAFIDDKVTKVRGATIGCWRCGGKEQMWILPGENLMDLYDMWVEMQ